MTNPFTDILTILGPNGEHWIKKWPWNAERTAFCVSGAMTVARNPTWYRMPRCDVDLIIRDILADIIRAEYPERLLPNRNRRDLWHVVTDFNDDSATVFPEVRAVLEKGQARWEEEHMP